MLRFLKRCIISLAGKDDKDLRVQQVSYNGIAQNAEVYAPYGMSYNVPENALSIIMFVGGDNGNAIVFPDMPNARKKNLKKGEIAIFNPLTGSFIYFKEDGSIEIDASAVTVGCTITVNGDVIADGISLKTHTHTGVQTGSGSTGGPQ